ncbi:hypothetical protein RclHR1_04010004 [Rhizophagus clarus]|uniref:Uncharacterized protein n=1 Tax=Rhizophagus clarus TaxID=94130 RepID=A0A2Z6S8W2_9GLOM|nr:hypothetical protein RclHR1_04010004 [Rhizophagus clarus]
METVNLETALRLERMNAAEKSTSRTKKISSLNQKGPPSLNIIQPSRKGIYYTEETSHNMENGSSKCSVWDKMHVKKIYNDLYM